MAAYKLLLASLILWVLKLDGPRLHIPMSLYYIPYAYILNWTFFIVIAGEVHEQDVVFKKPIALNLLKSPENLKKRQLNLLNSLKLKIAISAWGYF
ncbi:hypothetical protein CEXT_707061 [Caerostris extrusa]|uniref:Uncharacterized protein n=1 Tax=Caerostris extrusa TaxID=172846 RepID=A0AAV4R9G3_CAEEX|nr:hypothetical protein CEXT_707061 [Caerostris extrusa]